MRQRARVEEGLKLSRERAAEKQRLEALALDRRNKEKAELEEKKEVMHLQASSYLCCFLYLKKNVSDVPFFTHIAHIAI